MHANISVPAHDRKEMSTTDYFALRDWAKSLGVRPDELRRAVRAVGENAQKVREYLKSDK